jgi:hypothetical protein
MRPGIVGHPSAYLVSFALVPPAADHVLPGLTGIEIVFFSVHQPKQVHVVLERKPLSTTARPKRLRVAANHLVSSPNRTVWARSARCPDCVIRRITLRLVRSRDLPGLLQRS